METNTQPHDALFKWLITAFYADFFKHYFPKIDVGVPTFLDKEFVEKFEVLKNNIESDLFLSIEAAVNGVVREIVVIIEHKSWKTDVMAQTWDYLCYAMLLKKRPVWVIVIYTDDHQWQTPVPDTIEIGFNSREGVVALGCDIIKVNDEKSAELSKSATLLEKLLALKANDKGCDRQQLVREIYRTMDALGETLDSDRKALIYKFVQHYSKLPESIREKIEKEYNMSVVASTITEYYELKGRQEGRQEGKQEGELRGELKGELNSLDKLFKARLIPEDVYRQQRRSVEIALADLEARLANGDIDLSLQR